MFNKQRITVFGMCLSLSSMLVAAETTATNQPNVENFVTSDAASAQVVATTRVQSNHSVSAAEDRPNLIHRSLDQISKIGNQSFEQIGALSSKISVNANASQPTSVKDPFERFNRKIFNFNSTIDKHILLPVARVYEKALPPPVRRGVTQFFRNLATPWTAVNNLLQGHPGTSIESLSRFVINTTTTLGFYDVAGVLGVERSEEDFGQTLGVWGIGSGPYVMLPFFGPSTIRDTFGRAVDQIGSPQSYINNNWEKLGITGLRFVNLRSRLIGLENLVQGDQYSMVRDVYLQDRQFKSTDGNVDSTTTPNNFGSDGFGDSDSEQQKSQNIDSPATFVPQAESDSTQISAQSDTITIDITADTPIDASAMILPTSPAQL